MAQPQHASQPSRRLATRWHTTVATLLVLGSLSGCDRLTPSPAQPTKPTTGASAYATPHDSTALRVPGATSAISSS